MIFKRALLAAAMFFAAAHAPIYAQATAPRKPQVPDLKVEKYSLANGLEVILHLDRSTPVVDVDIWYKVGSKNEKKGRTGFAHLFEHLMFQGSKNHNKEYFEPLEKIGAQINGSTNTDRTNYYETVPSNYLELALWLEADRMGFLLPALSQEKLDNQREVVKNERRQRVDNVPYGQSMEKMLEALYPSDHPYYHSVIGSMADLSAASLDDVSNFFRTYYSPNNATLVISGDFDTAKAKAWVEKYYGPLPRGPEVAKLPAMVPALAAPKSVKMTDRVALARAQLTWPTVERGNPDEKPLDVLASVLGQLPKENRLFKALSYDRQLAASVMAFHPASVLSGTFTVSITARPDQNENLDELVRLADAEIAKIIAEGPTAEEVTKAQNSEEADLIKGLQSAHGKAEFLHGNNFFDGDPLAYKKEMEKLFEVTPADVQRVAKKYLTANRVRLDITPGAPAERAPEAVVDKSQQAPLPKVDLAEVKDTFDRTKQPEAGPTPIFIPPAIVRRKLSNGMSVLVAERHELPILTVSLAARGGEVNVPLGQEGLASLAMSLVTEGTAKRNTQQLASELSMIGADLNAGGGLENSSFSVTTLTKHTDKAMEIFKDVLLNASFPEKEMGRLKLQRLSALARKFDSANGIAGDLFPKLLYGEKHPYGRDNDGTAATIRGLNRGQAETYYKMLFNPANVTAIVVGDITPEAAEALLEKNLGEWKGGQAVKMEIPAPAPEKKPGMYLVNKAAAAQSVLSVGLVGVARNTPDYFPLVVMNAVLGGQFSSRLNLNLREEKGYTYGARSSFAFNQGPGPFSAGASVQTAVTKESVIETVKELTEITSKRPVTAAELAFAKDRLIKGFPGRFDTTFAMAGALSDLVRYNLPDDYFSTYQSKIESVNAAAVNGVSGKYLPFDKMTILVVGDESKVKDGLKSLPYGANLEVIDVKPPVAPAGAQGKARQTRQLQPAPSDSK
ncbi:MAG: pitrilysin family protein [Planctomycetota bacterium]